MAATALTASATIPLAAGQDHERAIHIEYSAPASCPDGDDFFAQVRARSRRVRRVGAGSQTRTFVVSIARDEQASTGHLVMRDVHGNAADREVFGDSCAEVVAALALITALAADPDALSTSRQDSAKPASEAPSSALSDPSRASASRSASTPATSGLDRSVSPARRDRWNLSLIASAAGSLGVSPRMLLGFPLFVQVAGPSHGLFAATLRAGFERASSGEVDVGGPNAHFVWTVGRAEGCPMRFTYGTLRFEPCARLEAGVLSARGTNISPAHEDSRAWLALGALLRGQWFAVGPVFLDFAGGLTFPLLRARYFFQPDKNVHQTPPVGWVVSAGLGVRFW
jgi:hypothetical protein